MINIKNIKFKTQMVSVWQNDWIKNIDFPKSVQELNSDFQYYFIAEGVVENLPPYYFKVKIEKNNYMEIKTIYNYLLTNCK